VHNQPMPGAVGQLQHGEREFQCTDRRVVVVLGAVRAVVHNRSELAILLLDNDSTDLDRLSWAGAFGVDIPPSGYARTTQVTTHGEILRDAVLAHPDCDAYLFLDVDVCFMADDTIGAMAAELTADSDLFAVRAIWSNEDGEDYDTGDGSNASISRIRETVRPAGVADWPEPYEFDTGYGDRVHPFCVLLRNDRVFRTRSRSPDCRRPRSNVNAAASGSTPWACSLRS
jgi:hypothetical protein